MSIRAKLLLVLAAGLLLVTGTGAFGLIGVGRIRDESTQLGDDVIPSLIAIDQISTTLAQYRILQSNHISTTDAAEKKAILGRMSAAETRMAQLITTYAPLAESPDEQAALAHLRETWPQFATDTHAKLIAPSNLNATANAFAAYHELDGEYTQLTAAVADLVSLHRQQSREALARSEAVQTQARVAVLAATAVAVVLMVVGWFLIASPVRRNIGALVSATDAISRGEFEHELRVAGRDELHTLGESFRRMQDALRQARDELGRQQSALAERARELEQTLGELREASATRDQLSDTVRSLASPVLPVMRGVLVMPLIGTIDTERAGLLSETLLHAIEHDSAHTVIIDVTGVPLVDTEVAAAIMGAASAAQLLGAETILVGIRPELAQTIVGLGLDLSRIITQADLEGGIRQAAARARRAQRKAERRAASPAPQAAG